MLGTIALDKSSRVPLYRQLFDALRQAILLGSLPPGARLPSSRDLAQDLNVGRNTVIAAFDQLVAEGYLEARAGSGTRIAKIMPDALSRVRATHLKPPPRVPVAARLSARGSILAAGDHLAANPRQSAFQPGLPALDEFPFAVWSRLVAHRTAKPLTDTLGYFHVGGYLPLRESVAEYLATARGVRCHPDQVIIVTGAQAALDLTARMTTDPGDRVWIEEPGYLGARGALLAAGAALHTVVIDADGIDVERGVHDCPDARMAYVTPSCQYPLGVTMSLQRRLQLIDWAHHANAWIIEDDYDSEYRYSGHPMSALYGLDNGQRVIYMGSFSKTLFPALRLAYLVVPESLQRAFRMALRHTGQDSPLIEQAALADFIDDGHYASHLRRMRKLYWQRQQRLIARIDQRLNGMIRVTPSDAGMQLIGWVDNAKHENALIARGADSGLKLVGIGGYYYGQPTKTGLNLGYAGVREAAIDDGVETLQEICESL